MLGFFPARLDLARRHEEFIRGEHVVRGHTSADVVHISSNVGIGHFQVGHAGKHKKLIAVFRSFKT